MLCYVFAFIVTNVSVFFFNFFNTKLFTFSCRSSFLGSLLQPESLRQDWLELGLSHDAPQPSDTLTAEGQPRCAAVYRTIKLLLFGSNLLSLFQK